MQILKILQVLGLFEKVLGTLLILLLIVQIPFGGPLLLLLIGPYVMAILFAVFIIVSIFLFMKMPTHNRAFSWIRICLYGLFLLWDALLLKILSIPVSQDFVAENRSSLIHFLGFGTLIVIVILIGIYLIKKFRK